MTAPPAISVFATLLAVSIGMAKPTPELSPESLSICALTPITLPLTASISGPPELPWLIAASVWIDPESEKRFGAVIVRLIALTIPAVIVSGRPYGLPSATTLCPGSTPAEVPSESGCSFAAATLTLITAMSVDLSLPMSVAFAVEPSWKRTLIEFAPSTTCSFVTMSPFVSITKPLPSACVCCCPPGVPNGVLEDEVESTVMSTTPGATSL